MTPLGRRIAARIAATGPIPLADYMSECLLDPEHGYYATRDPLGVAGDFTTAPEISQMFGELLGLSLAQAWLDQGRPTPFTLAELGPGRGTLMADLWRATGAVPGFHDAARVHLVEASATLRAVQARTLAALPNPVWLTSVDVLPAAPLFVVANEFFDALPIRQFERTEQAWQERMVGVGPDGALIPGLAAPAPQPTLDRVHPDARAGAVAELRPAAAPILTELARRIADQGGAAVIVDYGGEGGRGDSFQAVAGHAYVDPFAAPGAADLTAHVDFADIAATARAAGTAASAVTPQGVMLERLGITARARALAHGRGQAGHDSVATAHRRLTHPEEMGSLFKGLGLTPANAPPLPGLPP